MVGYGGDDGAISTYMRGGHRGPIAELMGLSIAAVVPLVMQPLRKKGK